MSQLANQEENLSHVSRCERLIVAAVAAWIVLAPPFFVECFPVTSNPMFARHLEQRCIYRISDAEGNALNKDVYGLRSNVNWYLESFYPVKYPENIIASPGVIPNESVLCGHVQRRATELNSPFPISLKCEIWGPLESGGVGITNTKHWIIEPTTWRLVD